MSNITEKISHEAIITMKKAIIDAGYNEVFFRGIPNDDGVVTKAQVLARGNAHSVPAIMHIMRKGEVIIHNHPSGYLYPSDADAEIASMYSNKMAGASYIVNNDLSDIYVITELVTIKNVNIDIIPYFEKQGALSNAFEGFEYRPEQLEMAKVIESGLNREKKVVVEAGTGTGKTLAYLIPVIEWALANKQRAVISTNTINLQEQLLSKDIPIAQKVINKKFRYLLVKGRGNYLCNRKFNNMATNNQTDLSDYSNTQKDQLNYILKWGNKTKQGDKAELPFEADSNIWEMFCSESDLCAGNKCQYRNECFFMISREEKKQADILITNHHMFFSDLAIRKEVGFNTDLAIIPNYALTVFDEAHNIEKVARDYFSIEASKYSFTKIMNYIYVFEGKKKSTGGLENLRRYLIFKKSEDHKNIIKDLDTLKEMHKKIYIKCRNYFNFIIDRFSKGEIGTFSFRIKDEEAATSPFFEELSSLYKELSANYLSYYKKVQGIAKELEDDEDKDGIVNDFVKYCNRLENFFNSLKFVNDRKDKEYIYWIDVNSKKSNAKLIATPLKVDKELKNNLFIHLKEMIFTSATIAVGNNFKYFKESIGLDEPTLDKIIMSPFDYDHQMKVYMPLDLPDPNNHSFLEELADYLKNLLIRSHGNTFILFTSYKMLNYVYYTIRDDLESFGLDLFVQGMAPRSQLLSMFTKSQNPVLFGTDSFWEGVDIKGEKLSSVIIAKLPFKVPNDPVTEAIIEHIISQGKNSFTEYQVPEAVIKFKQGIGRLIRSKTDTGIITILDNRVITKYYGKYFKNSLPTKNIMIATKINILNDIGK